MEALFCRFGAAVRGVILVLGLVMVLGLSIFPAGRVGASVQPTSNLEAIAQFIPRQALVALSLAKPVKDIPAPLGDSLAQILADQWQQFGLKDFNRLQDWADDELAIALLPRASELEVGSKTASTLGRTPETLLGDRLLWVIKIRRSEGATSFLERLWQRQREQGDSPVTETYQGVRVLSTQPSVRESQTQQPFHSLATAQVKDQVLLIAAQPQLIKAALASAQSPDASLGLMSSYRQAIATLPPNPWGFVYGNLQTLGDPDQLAPRYDRLFIVLNQQSNQFKIDLALKGTQPELDENTLAEANSRGIDPTLIQRWPGDPAMAILGQALPQRWQEFNAALETYPLGRARSGRSILDQAIADLGREWPINLTNTIFPLGSQTYALGLWPQNAASTQLDWLWTSPMTAATDQTLTTLTNLATTAGFSLDQIPVGDQSLQAWTKLSPDLEDSGRLTSDVAGVYGQDGGILRLGSSLVTVSDHLDNLEPPGKTKKTRSKDADWLKLNQWGFKEEQIQGLLYLNWPQSRLVLMDRLPLLRVLDAWTAPLGDHLQSMTFINQGPRGRFQRATVLIEWK